MGGGFASSGLTVGEPPRVAGLVETFWQQFTSAVHMSVGFLGLISAMGGRAHRSHVAGLAKHISAVRYGRRTHNVDRECSCCDSSILRDDQRYVSFGPASSQPTVHSCDTKC